MAKTWREKFDTGRDPTVEVLDKPFGGLAVGDRMLISSPDEIDAYVRSLSRGTFVDVPRLRADLAREHGADGMCPLTAGIFLRIVSEVALERMAAGDEDVTPFWRVVDPKSPLAKKLSCGPELVVRMREEEAG